MIHVKELNELKCGKAYILESGRNIYFPLQEVNGDILFIWWNADRSRQITSNHCNSDFVWNKKVEEL